MKRVAWFGCIAAGARLHRRFETLVSVSDVDQLVLLVLLASILFLCTRRNLVSLVHWPIPLALRVLESSSLVLASSCIKGVDHKGQRMV